MPSSSDFRNSWFVGERPSADAIFLSGDFDFLDTVTGEEDSDELPAQCSFLFFAPFMDVTPEERSCL
jgi:hypothetical protein